MATLGYHTKRKRWRVDYSLRLPDRTKRRTKYARTQDEGRHLQASLLALESACRSGMARTDDVEDWVRRGYIKVEEAGDVFTGYLDSLDRDQRARLSRTNYGVARLTSARYPLDAAARLVGVGLSGLSLMAVHFHPISARWDGDLLGSILDIILKLFATPSLIARSALSDRGYQSDVRPSVRSLRK